MVDEKDKENEPKKEEAKAPAEEVKADSAVETKVSSEEKGEEKATEKKAEGGEKAKEAKEADSEEEKSAGKPEPKPRTRKGKKNIPNGVVYINATFNNTLITIADTNGNVIAWSSAGSKGFKGSRKNTPFAAQVASEDACRKAMEHGLRSVSIEVRGPGAGRESAIRAVSSCGILITMMKDTTPVPHNGCRPPKRRRV